MDCENIEDVHNGIFYRAVKKGGTMGFAGKWMETEDTVLTEVTRARKDKHCMFFRWDPGV